MISTNESTEFIIGHVIYNPAYTYKFQLKTTQVLDELHFEDALMMYDLCRYEKARNPDDVSVWCAAFEDEDLLVC